MTRKHALHLHGVSFGERAVLLLGEPDALDFVWDLDSVSPQRNEFVCQPVDGYISAERLALLRG